MTEAKRSKEAKVWEITWTSISDDGLLGWVSSTEEAEGIRTAFEIETGMKFVTERRLGIWRSPDGKDLDPDFSFFKTKSKIVKIEAKEMDQDTEEESAVGHLHQTENHKEVRTEGQTEGQPEGQPEGQQESESESQVEGQEEGERESQAEGQIEYQEKVLAYKVRFTDVIAKDAMVPCDGVPFIGLSRFVCSCVYGRDRHSKEKERIKREMRDQKRFIEEGIPIPKRRKRGGTKKVCCPALLTMKKVVRFPEFKVNELKARNFREMSERVRAKLLEGEEMKKEIRVYIKLPKDEDHENHELVERPKKKRKRLYKYNPNSSLATLEDIEKAYKVVQESDLCVRTPMMHHAQDWLRLDVGCELSLKLENTQITGSFKVRGLANQLAHIPRSIAKNELELVTMSAGNYGKAFSFAMQELGLKARVLMPDTAPQVREDIMRRYGAEVERLPSSQLQPTVDRYVSNDGMHYLHPFDDIHLICGHGSAGLEILEDLPDPDVIVVCCGGGGLLAGIATAVKLSGKSHTRIYGVEPEKACCMYKSKQDGKPVKDPSVHSIASGLAPPFAGSNAYRHVAKYVDDILLLSEMEITAAVSRLYHAGLVVEPAGAAAFGAILFGKVPDITGKKVVVVITGSNVSPGELCNIVQTS